jgi:integral membrane protein (TIGR01906 family)
VLGGARRPLFNEREIVHMEDVQKLMQAVFRVGALAGLYAALCAAGMLLWRRGAALRPLGRLLLWGAGLTFGGLVLVASLSLVDFSELFVRFHELSFRNDFWMLDPRTDYLVILFPEGFWLDVTLRIAAMTAGEAAVIGIAGLVLVRSRSQIAEVHRPITGRG